MNKSQNSFFDSHPVISGVALFVIIYIILDLTTGAILIPTNYQEFRIRDSYFHHGIEENNHSITNWGQNYYWFYSNSLGFRDDSVRTIPLISDKYRILFLGDSHTEAVGIPYEESFAGILAKETAGKGIGILNGSAVSYSPKIHFLKAKYLIEEAGLKVDEIFVVIDMSDLNNEIAYENFEPELQSELSRKLARTIRRLKKHSATVYLGDHISRKVRNRFFTENMADTENSNFELYSTFFSEFDNAELLNNPDFHHVSRWLEDDEFKQLATYSLELGQSNILQLKNLCDANHIKLNLSVHPWQDQILKGDTTNMFVESWRAFSDENGIGFVNLYTVFINNSNPVLTASQCYIPQDNHWNERGHALVAKELIRILFKQDKQDENK